MSKFWVKLNINTFTIENVYECMENVWDKFLNLSFQHDVTIWCKYDMHQSLRTHKGLSFRWRPFLHPLSKFLEQLNITTFTIENVYECMGKIF